MREAAKPTSPFRRFPSRLSCRFAWQPWHFVTFQPVWFIRYRKCQNWRKSRTKCSFFCAHVSRLESLPCFPVASPCLWGKLRTPHSTLYTPHCALHNLRFRLLTPHFTHSTLPTPHFTRHTPYFTLHTLHFTLHTPHSTLSTPHCRLVTGEICTRLFK